MVIRGLARDPGSLPLVRGSGPVAVPGPSPPLDPWMHLCLTVECITSGLHLSLF